MSPRIEHSTMMDIPLTIGRMLRHGGTRHATSTVCEVQPDMSTLTVGFAELGQRCAALAAALEQIGVGRGDIVGVMLGSRVESMEAMLAIPAMGAVVHPINVLLHEELIATSIGSIGEEILITGPNALAYLAQHRHALDKIRHIILIGTSLEGIDTESWPGITFHAYEQLLDGMPARRDWPELDERSPAVVCHTSGTTGVPKAVVYSHRAIWLHATQFASADGMALSRRDTVATAVPLFHVMGWGLPYAALLIGFDLVFSHPGEPTALRLGQALKRACLLTAPTAMVATPIHFSDFLRAIEGRPEIAESLERVVIGGSALPQSLLSAVERDYDFSLLQAWGMTETGPLGTVTAPSRSPRLERSADHTDGLGSQRRPEVLEQGRFNAYMDARIVDVTGSPIAGATGIGELEVRGPFVTGSYLGTDPAEDPRFDEGWLRTGDIAHVTPDGRLTIIDRVADAILSGGEWISSVELENAVMELDGVDEAACIGVPDTRWGNRPLCVVVAEPDAGPLDPSALRAAMTEVEMWKRPDNWAFVSELPRTSVGKFDKKRLRTWFAQGRFTIQAVTN